MIDDLDPKDRILQATLALIDEQPDPDAITVRQIAERAEVGTGLINYHFGSKEALMSKVIGALMRQEAGLDLPATPDDGDPVERVRAILRQTSHIAMRYPSVVPTFARLSLLSDDYGAERTLLPHLRAHFDGALSEPEIRATAVQIVAPLQAMAVRAEDFRRFAEIDLYNPAALDALVDLLVDNVLG